MSIRPPSAPSTILLCCNSVFGMVNFRGGIIRSLIAAGSRVIVVAPPDSYVDALKALGVEYVEWRIVGRGTRLLGELSGIRQLRAVYRDARPDIAFHFTIKPVIYGALVCRTLGIPFVSVVTGLGYAFINDNWVSRVAKLLYRATLRWSMEVWLLNEDDRQAMKAHGLLAGVDVRMLPGEGVDTVFFAPYDAKLGPRPQFLFVARLLRDKGVLEFVNAARLLRQAGIDAEFALLGAVDADSPTAISRAEVQAWEAEGIVTYVGITRDVRPHIAAAHCIVLPSYREGLPRSLLEASAMARPVIATDVPGCRDVVVNGETGYLCEARSADALAATMARFLNLAEEERKQMGMRGQQFVRERFDEALVQAQYNATLRRLDARKHQEHV
jgi:glycosyltransferase involved in cell wall biosynthesis